jgi:hypothetical protein
MQPPKSNVFSLVIPEPDSYEQSPFNDKYGTTIDGYGTSSRKSTTGSHRICGLVATTFGLLLALITAIAAAAVGGAVEDIWP